MENSYSFTENGDEVCFHSPLNLPGGSINLGEWLAHLTAETTQEQMIYGDGAWEMLSYLIKGGSADEMLPHPEGVFEESDVLAAWMMWGEHLLKEYSIHQFALMQWKD